MAHKQRKKSEPKKRSRSKSRREPEIMAPAPPPPGFDLQKMQADIACLSLMPAQEIRNILNGQLVMMSLKGNDLLLKTLRNIEDPNTSAKERANLVGNLGTLAFFTESVTRQRLVLTKAAFLDDLNPHGEGAELPEELAGPAWEDRYGPQLQLPAASAHAGKP